ncbi:MAG: serine hydrolase [Chitinophagaceae bacterium]
MFAEYSLEKPGVAVVVVKDGKISFQKGYGMDNLEYQVPITPQTVFNIASVSKQFTAFAVFLLEKQGKISFEDDIRKYIRNFLNMINR